MSSSFIDNSISDIHQTNSQTPSHKSSTTSNHKFGTNISTNSINNNSMTVDINRSYNYDQHHDNKINQNTDNLNITARLQRHNAKRVIPPKYDQINNVSSTEQGPTQLLNSMLNDLSSELSQHGAKTNPRGQCYACKKAINGTVNLNSITYSLLITLILIIFHSFIHKIQYVFFFQFRLNRLYLNH